MSFAGGFGKVWESFGRKKTLQKIQTQTTKADKKTKFFMRVVVLNSLCKD